MLYYNLFFLIGSVIIGFIFGFLFKSYISSNKISLLNREKEFFKEKWQYNENLLEEFRQRDSEQQKNINNLQNELGQITAANKLFNKQIESFDHFFSNTKEQLNQNFENLANKILEKNSYKLSSLNQDALSHIIEPFKTKLDTLEKQMHDIYLQETKDRAFLKSEISSLTQLNQKLSQDAINLTNVLKGNVKTQGLWGEVIIERILEKSGLRKGEEYIREGKQLYLRNEIGELQKPDVIIKLPENRHIIIDCKVSVISYQRYLEEDDKERKSAHKKQLIQSVESHIKNLGKKDYYAQEKLITPELVLLFMPLEGLLSVVFQEKEDLWQNAWEKNIVIVTPSTLLATLRTIANIWKQEKQNKNVMEIVNRAGQIHDKLVIYLSFFKNLGDSIEKSNHFYNLAKNNLTEGKGNIVKSIKNLVDIGANAKKKIPEEYLL